MYRSRQSRRGATPSDFSQQQSPVPQQQSDGDADERKELALRQAEDALWKIPRELEGIKRKDFNPVALALQMMDTSSLGKSYDEFRESYTQLNESLDGIVNEYYAGFNESILTFSGLHDRIHNASGSVNTVKGSLQRVRRMILEERGSLDQLYTKSNQLGAIVSILKRLEEVKRLREELAEYAREKKFLTAAGKLVQDMHFVFDPELDPIEALSGLRQQLEKEKSDLLQRITDELHSHIYLKSLYCERRMGAEGEDDVLLLDAQDGTLTKKTEKPGRQRIRRQRKARKKADELLDGDEGNPEADSFAYVEMLLESLSTLDSTGEVLQEIKSSIPLELSRLIDGIVAEVEERNRALLTKARVLDADDTAARHDSDREVLMDFARILFARLESVLEYHDYVLDIVRHLDRNERYSLTSPMSPAMPVSHPQQQQRRSRPYTIGDVWEAMKTEVLALLRDYLIIEDPQGAADVAHPVNAGIKDLFHMEKASGEVADAVESMYSQIESRFQDLTAAIPDRRKELTTPAVIDEYASDQQNSLQHKLLAEPDIEHAPTLLNMALGFARHIAPIVAVQGTSSALVSPSAIISPSVRRSMIGEISPTSPLSPNSASGEQSADADEFLQVFFKKVVLPHAEAQAMRVFDSILSASDAFDVDPSTYFGGRPVFRSAAAVVPLLRSFGGLLNSLDMFRGENWTILLQLSSRYYDRCLELFRDTVRSPEGQMYLSVRWSETTEMQLLFDRRLRQQLKGGLPASAADVREEIRQEELFKSDRSLNSYELVFDVKRLVTIAHLHQTLEWLLEQLDAIAAARAKVLRGHGDSITTAALVKRHEADKARVVNQYKSLSIQCLMVLCIEIRLHCMHYLDLAMREGDYNLDSEALEPEAYIQALNADASTIEEKMEACLPVPKLGLVFAGVSVLMAHILIANTRHIRQFNSHGNAKMIRNILALQQNLTNIALPEEGGLDSARRFYELYDLGADGILKHISEHGAEFSFEDYRRMVGFVYSGNGQAAALDGSRANSLLEASQSDQYGAHIRRLQELLSQMNSDKKPTAIIASARSTAAA
ncbi:exocyst subunit [Coemansia sp. RSA 552]|nr:exocyst subunit [Coemansia sp. RSA 552]